jgi:hypothetical protein
MSSSRLLGVMAVLSTAIVTPVTAQPVISGPGYCAQFYPNEIARIKDRATPIRIRTSTAIKGRRAGRAAKPSEWRRSGRGRIGITPQRRACSNATISP